MEHFKRYHALGTFLFYVLIVNLKSATSYIDAIILGLLFAYIVVTIVSEHKHTPDIRKEMDEAISSFKAEYQINLKSMMAEAAKNQKEAETEIEAIKSKVAQINSAKSLGIANARF